MLYDLGLSPKMPRIEIELHEHERDEDLSLDTSSEVFDRLAFAERAIALVRPAATTVAICPGTDRVEVTAGRQWGRGPNARWAIVRVPLDASRRAIASAVLELVDGSTGGRHRRAWALDVLMSELGGGTSPMRMYGAVSSAAE